jgi:pimeloyl-ACP methyl ester carboxylesterase
MAATSVVLEGPGFPLSALLSEPRDAGPRAVIVALHGGGMNARYFDGPAHPRVSLLTLGASLGFTVLAVDRPGYGLSAAALPKGQDLTEQSAALDAMLAGFAARHDIGAGFLLLAHSWGAALALTAAAQGVCGPSLLGVDVSGIGHRHAAGRRWPAERHRAALHWGPLALYPPGTFAHARDLVTSFPARELEEIPGWPERFAAIAGRAAVPVRFTFAEYERWWCHDDATVADMAALFSRTAITVDHQPHAGHNISLGWAARSYHLRTLGFLEECITRRELRLRQ